eukprot:s1718_g7.t1
MELDTSQNSEPTAGADMTAVVPFVAAKSKAKAKPKAKAEGKSKAKAKARATAPSTESQDEVDIEDQLEDQLEDQARATAPSTESQDEVDIEDQLEGQAEDQTEADDVDVIDGFVQEEGVQEEDVPNDICVICHSEMNQDQAGMFHLSLFYEPLIIALEALVCGHLFHSECINRYCREAARGSNDPAPVQDDADVNDVNELINEIESQMVDDSTHREQRVEINDPVVD